MTEKAGSLRVDLAQIAGWGIFLWLVLAGGALLISPDPHPGGFVSDGSMAWLVLFFLCWLAASAISLIALAIEVRGRKLHLLRLIAAAPALVLAIGPLLPVAPAGLLSLFAR